MLTETIDSERTIRRAERYFIDSNMILACTILSALSLRQNATFCLTDFTDKDQKASAKNLLGFPDIAASAAPVKIALILTRMINHPYRM